MSRNIPQSKGAPQAEVKIAYSLVRGLVDAQAPEFSEMTLRYLATGWDNEVYRLGDDLLVRLPRRALAETLGSRERRWLLELSKETGIDVGVPIFFGRPTEYYPFTFSVRRYLPGVSAATTTRAERDQYASEFTNYLKRLHLAAPEDGPRSEFRGVELCEVDSKTRRQLIQIPDKYQRAANHIWDEAVTAEVYSGVPLWLHGDPHPHNTISTLKLGRYQLAGLVDFGDICIGDPASDLGMLWLHFSAQVRDEALKEYGVRLGEPMYQRARGWALRYSMIISELDVADVLGIIGRETLELMFE